MDNNIIKKIIIAVIVIIIIILMVISKIVKNKKDEKYHDDSETISIEQIKETIIYDNQKEEENSELKKVTNRNNYYVVKKITDKFYSYYSVVYADLAEYYGISSKEVDFKEIQKNNKTTLYNTLDENYIRELGITVDNIDSKLPKISSGMYNDIIYMRINNSNNTYEPSFIVDAFPSFNNSIMFSVI